MYAMNVARFQRFPESRRQGGRALPRLVLFASEEVGTAMGAGGGGSGSSALSPLSPQCHYSIQKGAAFLGIGTDNVVLVRADERWELRGRPGLMLGLCRDPRPLC